MMLQQAVDVVVLAASVMVLWYGRKHGQRLRAREDLSPDDIVDEGLIEAFQAWPWLVLLMLAAFAAFFGRSILGLPTLDYLHVLVPIGMLLTLRRWRRLDEESIAYRELVIGAWFTFTWPPFLIRWSVAFTSLDAWSMASLALFLSCLSAVSLAVGRRAAALVVLVLSVGLLAMILLLPTPRWAKVLAAAADLGFARHGVTIGRILELQPDPIEQLDLDRPRAEVRDMLRAEVPVDRDILAAALRVGLVDRDLLQLAASRAGHALARESPIRRNADEVDIRLRLTQGPLDVKERDACLAAALEQWPKPDSPTALRDALRIIELTELVERDAVLRDRMGEVHALLEQKWSPDMWDPRQAGFSSWFGPDADATYAACELIERFGPPDAVELGGLQGFLLSAYRRRWLRPLSRDDEALLAGATWLSLRSRLGVPVPISGIAQLLALVAAALPLLLVCRRAIPLPEGIRDVLKPHLFRRRRRRATRGRR